MPSNERLSISVAGQELVLNIDPSEREDVQSAARMVEQRMNELAQRGAVGGHKQAVMAAFQFAFDFVRLSRDPMAQPQARAELERRLDGMIRTADKVLERKGP